MDNEKIMYRMLVGYEASMKHWLDAHPSSESNMAMNRLKATEEMLLELRRDCPTIERDSIPSNLVPFDFSIESDREAIKGKHMRSTEGRYLVLTLFHEITDESGNRRWVTDYVANGKELFEKYVFIDGHLAGLPVGKEIAR